MKTKEQQDHKNWMKSIDLTDQGVRTVRAAAQGMSFRQYEQLLRHIGVDYLNH